MGAVVLVLEIVWVLGALLVLDSWFTEVEVDENEVPL